MPIITPFCTTPAYRCRSRFATWSRPSGPKLRSLGTSVEIGDIAYGEANTAVRRPLPLWPYSAATAATSGATVIPIKAWFARACRSLIFPGALPSYPNPRFAPASGRSCQWRRRSLQPARNHRRTAGQDGHRCCHPGVRLAKGSPGVFRWADQRGPCVSARSAVGRDWFPDFQRCLPRLSTVF